MAVLGRAAEDRLGLPLCDMPLAEVYSCFPAAVRVQQRELGLDPAGTPTLSGGMTFAGGPFNHYVLQSTVALGRRLRAEPGELGLVTTVSGMLSKPGLAVWSAAPPPGPGGRPLLADLAHEASAATAVVPVVDTGPRDRTPAAVASFTVTYGGRRRARPGAHGHRGRPPRWGPHGRHLRRCRHRPPRRGRGPRSGGRSR